MENRTFNQLETMHFEDTSLLITHYNRSQSLERLLQAFERINVTFSEVVVSDDCSRPEHLIALENLAEQFKFRLVTTPINGGLGHNINKGQAVITTPYTLYVQEDFVPTEAFPERLIQALGMMGEDQAIDFMRFYAYIPYPYLKPQNDFGFSEMHLPFPGYRYKKIYQYSDHPHLRRSTFIEKFGKYKEGVSVDRAEYQMCISFLRNKGKGYFYNDFKGLFDQVNTTTEPSTATRSDWKNRSNFFISSIRNIYRQLKYNYDIYL